MYSFYVFSTSITSFMNDFSALMAVFESFDLMSTSNIWFFWRALISARRKNNKGIDYLESFGCRIGSCGFLLLLGWEPCLRHFWWRISCPLSLLEIEL
jgi:hypothetical protein